ncbi:hypothetical protein [Streptomyces xanthophaeus]|uniref:Uncharacterized protein n=1 Tax=Streptomyces xanthophaeus TaxID=67385 RepID=A0A919LHU0_9ACTN|nr:hypothetical protein [Streptomyces xanthophaeus]GHI88532.1 hypothetical protein Sxan_58960 [Streptomyces xanthophaeus]
MTALTATPISSTPTAPTAPGAAAAPGARSGPAVSRPVRWAAHATALTVLPSGLWRLAIAVGIPVGWGAGSGLEAELFPGRWSFYLLGLSAFAECLGLLALGLVQRWGEVVPSWVPGLRGRRIPPLAAVVPAALGAVALTLIAVPSAFHWSTSMAAPGAPTGAGWWLMTLCYAPLVLWGPLLAVVTAAYWRRRRMHG